MSNFSAPALYNFLRDRVPPLARAALPQTCALCAAASATALLCEACRHDLPRLPPACPVCALPSTDAATCGRCLQRAPPFAATIAAFAYAFPLDRLVQALKYQGRLALAEGFAAALAAAVRARSAALPERVIALPLAPARQRERGFNQAAEIARAMARDLGLPLARGLVRVRDAPPQAGLPLPARVHNLRDAFECETEFSGRHVALVDDVMTSGTTLAAAARALRRAGATRVDAWVVARTLR